MKSPLKIGTRSSNLALWQSKLIQNQLSELGYQSELVPIKSFGEIFTETPLYELGVQGIFTKTIDAALLNKQVDLAVHSLKDVPTQLAKGLKIAAIPSRGSALDVLIHKKPFYELKHNYVVATSSLRRKAQWLHRYPEHKTDSLRGNIKTRLKKLEEHEGWDAAIFAAAGVERLGLQVPYRTDLHWMIPAPAQGALCVVIREEDQELAKSLQPLNDFETQLATTVERNFLRKTMGGCSMPIGAFAQIFHQEIKLKACILTVDGKRMREVEVAGSIHQAEGITDLAFSQIKKLGGDKILESFRKI